MYELTESEIEQISGDIDQQGLTYTLLKNELLDHLCCNIEAEMENGMTFNDAYRKVKRKMGTKRIRQIQDETLYLINKKYRIMKKTMYGLGIAIPIIIVIALVFKLQHWPGGGILFTVALSALAVLFLPIFAMVKIRDTRQQNEPIPTAFFITGMIAGMLIIIGALGKIQHMPGAGAILSLGIVSMGIVFLPMYAILKFRNASEKNEPINKTYYILGIIAGILFLAGTLFKIMHWPGAGVVLFSSWLAVALILLPLLVLSILKQEGNRLNNFILVVLAFSFVSILLLSTLNRSTTNWVEGFLTTERSLVTEAEYFKSESDRLLREIESAGSSDAIDIMQSIHSEADEVCSLMRSLQKDMVLFVKEENKAAIQKDGNIDYTIVAAKDIDYPSIVIMLRTEGSDANASILKSRLESFRDKTLAASENQELKSYISSQLVFYKDEWIDESWEELYFHGALIQSATHLSMYQSTVRMIEYELLRELSREIAVD
ncbi:hypothetical protein ACFLTA_02840 [Bacteroidota bacterium]